NAAPPPAPARSPTPGPPPAQPTPTTRRDGTDPRPFVGTWRGDYDEGEGKGKPGATLTIAILGGQPRAALTMARSPIDADGSLNPTAVGLPILEQWMQEGALRLRTRDDHFRYKWGPPGPVDIDWAFDLTGEDSGSLRVLESSFFARAQQRGEVTPLPPPPMKMTRDR